VNKNTYGRVRDAFKSCLPEVVVISDAAKQLEATSGYVLRMWRTLALRTVHSKSTWSEFATRSVGGTHDLPMFSLVSGINAQMMMMWAPKTIA
jgi:hypothetical protein